MKRKPLGSCLLIAILLVCILCTGNRINAQIISTIAGDGTAGYMGDGLAATLAELNQPFDIKVDNAGNVYFADEANNRIRKIDTSGVITTVVGGGLSLGDGGPATAAQLNSPVGLVFDGAGNMYLSDLGHSRIRKVNTSGIISTIAGTGTAGFSGDGGPATAALLNLPEGMSIDPYGNIYFTEEANQRIRKIDTSGIITTIAGSGPTGLGVGTYGGDGGPATMARLNRPYGVFVDRHSNVYIADGWNSRVRKVDTSGNISTVAGGGSMSGVGMPATAASLNVIIDVAADTFGNLLISEGNGCRILKVNTSGILTTIAGHGTCALSGDGGIDTAAEVSHPGGVAFSACGNIYIADWGNACVRKVTNCSTSVDTTVTTGVTINKAGESSLHVYPNPNNGAFSVNILSGIEEPATLVATNILGQEVRAYTIATNNIVEVNLSTPGMYFLKASSIHGNWEAKVVVR